MIAALIPAMPAPQMRPPSLQVSFINLQLQVPPMPDQPLELQQVPGPQPYLLIIILEWRRHSGGALFYDCLCEFWIVF